MTGSAALVIQSHPSYTPAQVKSALVNTATHDVRTESGDVYAVDRVGAGRVDTLAAVQSKSLAYNAQSPNTTSVSFGVLEYAPGCRRSDPHPRGDGGEHRFRRAHLRRCPTPPSTNIPGVEYSFPSP